jgi:hypothetical protein
MHALEKIETEAAFLERSSTSTSLSALSDFVSESSQLKLISAASLV